jgi:hypothetical protein
MSKEVILNHERAVDGEVLSEQKEEYLFKGLDGSPSKVKVVIRCIGPRCYQHFYAKSNDFECKYTNLTKEECCEFEQEWNSKWNKVSDETSEMGLKAFTNRMKKLFYLT